MHHGVHVIDDWSH